MNNYLENSPPAYNRFIKNQVLTEDQLNAFLNYFNYQDKATRAHLIGVGIICGLEITFSSNEIILSSGIAVTTDGDLIQMKDANYIGFKNFKDSNCKYSHFQEKEQTIPLYELTQDVKSTDTIALSDFEGKTEMNLDDFTVLLYLEKYYKEAEDCSPIDCKSQGEEVIEHPRLLLVSNNDIQSILEKDKMFSNFLNDSGFDIREKLEHNYSQRVIHSTKKSSVIDFSEDYEVNFDEIINQINELSEFPIFNRIKKLDKIDVGDKKFDLSFEMKDLSKMKNANFGDAKIKLMSRQKNEIKRGAHFQHNQQFHKDLTDALNELYEYILYNEIGICLPDANSFPKHILLGEKYRHTFYPSSANAHSEDKNTLLRMFTRIHLMLDYFNSRQLKDLIITPSFDESHELGKRAIPAYYDLEKSKDPSKFIQNWREKSRIPVLNYFGYDYSEGFEPLKVNLKGNDFLRIEGHLGIDVLSAIKRLNEIKTENGLAFNIIPIALDGEPKAETINLDEFRVYFHDLQVMLETWNKDQDNLMKSASEFLTGFSAENPGTHLRYDDEKYIYIKQDQIKEAQLKVDVYKNITIKEKENIIASANNYEDSTSQMMERGKANYASGRFMQGKGPKIKVIQDSLIMDVGSLGYLANQVFVAQPNFNKNDLLVNVADEVRKKTNPSGNELFEVAVYTPIELLGLLKEIEDLYITDIIELTKENMQQYAKVLQAQCNKSKAALSRLQQLIHKKNEEVASKEWIGHYKELLQNLSASCQMIEKMKTLQLTVEDRKQEIIAQFKFENFINVHPSAEHFGGVSKGGTFILIYVPEDASKSIFKGKVFGDLSLPYLCCSKLPSSTFIFTNSNKGDEKSLDLPINYVCKIPKENVQEIELRVSPKNASVKAFINDKELENTILNKDSKTFFDPNIVAKEDYGKSISFTIDTEPTDAILTIIEMPVPQFKLENVSFEENNSIAAISFTNTTENREKFDFEWDFGDRLIATANDKEIIEYVKVEPGQVFTVNVVLTARNGKCPATIEEEISFDVPVIESEEEKSLRLPIDQLCKTPGKKTEEIEINIIPNSAKVRAFIKEKELENAIVKKDSKTFFDPNIVSKEDYGKLISFTIDNEPTDAILTIIEMPVPQFKLENVSFEGNNSIAVISFTNTTENREKFDFEWDFGDRLIATSSDKEIIEYVKVEPGQVFTVNVVLTARNGKCTATIEEEISFDVPVVLQKIKISGKVSETNKYLIIGANVLIKGTNIGTVTGTDGHYQIEADKYSTLTFSYLGYETKEVGVMGRTIINVTLDAKGLQPEKPIEDCLIFAKKEIETTIIDLEKTFNKNMNELSPFANMFKELQHSYGNWLKNEEKLSRGDIDEEDLKFIERIQRTLKVGMENNKYKEQKLFAIQCYYELILLYFYLQSCRKSNLNSLATIQKITLWTADTVSFKSNHAQEFKEALGAGDLVRKFAVIDYRFDKRYGIILKPLMKPLINLIRN